MYNLITDIIVYSVKNPTTSLFQPSCGRSQIHFQLHQRPSRELCPSIPPMLIPQAFFQYVRACTSKSILTVTHNLQQNNKKH